MKRNVISKGIEIPKISKSILKEMGFIYDKKEKTWTLSVGNPIDWYNIVLPKCPTWVDFRNQLFGLMNQGQYKRSKKERIALTFFDFVTKAYYQQTFKKATTSSFGVKVTHRLIEDLNKLDVGELG